VLKRIHSDPIGVVKAHYRTIENIGTAASMVVPIPLVGGIMLASKAMVLAKNSPRLKSTIEVIGQVIAKTRAGRVRHLGPRNAASKASNRTQFVSAQLDELRNQTIRGLHNINSRLANTLGTIEAKTVHVPNLMKDSFMAGGPDYFVQTLSKSDKLKHFVGDKIYKVLDPLQNKLIEKSVTRFLNPNTSKSPIVRQADKLYDWASRPKRIGNLGTSATYLVERIHHLPKQWESLTRPWDK